MTKHKKMKI